MQENIDKMSSFPDQTLAHILTFLPLKDAVRTSILSTRWRYLFWSMRAFGLDESSVVTSRNLNCFKNFVDRLLYCPNHERLECFRLTTFQRTYNDYLSGWICAALCRGVKEIDLHLYLLGHVIPTLVFTCQSLVTLKLDVEGSVIKVPSTICLPNLKTLHIGNLVLRDCSISCFISTFHVLEHLVLLVPKYEFHNTREINIQNLSLKTLVLDFSETGSRCFDYVVVINAPSLVHFQYIGYTAEDYTFSNMTSLKKAEITIFCIYDADREQSAIRLLQEICNVRSLYLSIDDDEGTLFQTRIDPVLAFHNLVELEFHNCGDDWRGTWLVEFLHCVPNLKTLIFNLAVVKSKFMFPPEDDVPSCLSSHLKEITISNFWGETHMFEMINYFLDNALILEKLKVGIESPSRSYCSLLKQLSIFKQLLSLPRSSKTCQVLTF